MKNHSTHIYQLLSLTVFMLFVVSCDTQADRKPCDYKVRLEYHYNEEGATNENLASTRINTIDEYIFDGDGVLYSVNPISADKCKDGLVSELHLPPGNYSAIALGNILGKSTVNEAIPGVTHRNDMMIGQSSISKAAGDYSGNCERIYYGYRTFRVEPNGISRIRVDMLNCHLVINYKIEWKSGTPPAGLTDFNIRITDVPAQYGFMPEFYYPEPFGTCAPHDPETCDDYNKICNSVMHYIPSVQNNSNANLTNYRYDISLTGNRLTGKTITYRIRNSGRSATYRADDFIQTTFNIYAGDKLIANPIPLNDYFTDMGEELDQALRQEYPLVFEIQEDGKVLVYFATVEDWDEGGHL